MIVKSLQDIIFLGKQETTGKFCCRETECPQMTPPVCSCAVLYPTGTEITRFQFVKTRERKIIDIEFFLLKLKTFCHVQSVWVLVGRGGW